MLLITVTLALFYLGGGKPYKCDKKQTYNRTKLGKWNSAINLSNLFLACYGKNKCHFSIRTKLSVTMRIPQFCQYRRARVRRAITTTTITTTTTTTVSIISSTQIKPHSIQDLHNILTLGTAKSLVCSFVCYSVSLSPTQFVCWVRLSRQYKGHKGRVGGLWEHQISVCLKWEYWGDNWMGQELIQSDFTSLCSIENDRWMKLSHFDL